MTFGIVRRSALLPPRGDSLVHKLVNRPTSCSLTNQPSLLAVPPTSCGLPNSRFIATFRHLSTPIPQRTDWHSNAPTQNIKHNAQQCSPQWLSYCHIRRAFSTTQPTYRETDSTKEPAASAKERLASARDERSKSTETRLSKADESTNSVTTEDPFGRSEKAEKAAQTNFRARLSKESDKSKKVSWSTLRDIGRLLKFAKPEMRTLSVAIVCLLISSLVSMALPFSAGKVLDLAISTAADARLFGLTLYEFLFALGCIFTVGAMANYGRIFLLRIVGERVVTRLRTQLYRKTLGQDAEFFDANRIGDLLSRLGSDCIIVAKSCTQNVSDGLRAIVSGTAGLGMMIWISPKLASVFFVAIPCLGGLAFVYARIIRRLSRDLQRSLGSLTKIGEERLGNVKTTQAFVGEIPELRRYNKQVRKIFDIGKKQAVWDARFYSTSGWMGNMVAITLLLYGGSLVKTGAMTVGDLTTFMMYSFFSASSLIGLSTFFSELMKGVGAADRLFELQDMNKRISSTLGTKVKSARGPITFENVTFAYPTRPAVSVFNGLNFEIPSGSNVCIVGPSGGGKSTVSSLLLRYYDPTSGIIKINGQDITKMNAKSLRRRIGFVAQEPVLFSGSIAENIAYGVPQATASDIYQAAQKANCSFISDFPSGMDTQVGARGAQLSGGQKQRIAIARALLKDPDILILDEATSALDAESETLVNAALAALLRGSSTTISIAHRLSTIKRSDQIIVLSNKGTVAEIGSYIELSNNPESEFSKLMEWQMGGGEDPAATTGGAPRQQMPVLPEPELNEEDFEEIEEEEDMQHQEIERKPRK